VVVRGTAYHFGGRMMLKPSFLSIHFVSVGFGVAADADATRARAPTPAASANLTLVW
jgi:hypothetical protein